MRTCPASYMGHCSLSDSYAYVTLYLLQLSTLVATATFAIWQATHHHHHDVSVCLCVCVSLCLRSRSVLAKRIKLVFDAKVTLDGSYWVFDGGHDPNITEKETPIEMKCWTKKITLLLYLFTVLNSFMIFCVIVSGSRSRWNQGAPRLKPRLKPRSSLVRDIRSVHWRW